MTPAAVFQIDQRTVSLSESCIDPFVCCLASSLSVERSPENRPDWRQCCVSPRARPAHKGVGVGQQLRLWTGCSVSRGALFVVTTVDVLYVL